MSSSTLAEQAHGVLPPRLRPRMFLVLVIAVLMVISFLLGVRQSERLNILRGSAIIGTSAATVIVDGYAYGFVMDLTWFDSGGGQHSKGRPDCLTEVGSTAPIEFAWVNAPEPDGSLSREVTWVRCTT